MGLKDSIRNLSKTLGITRDNENEDESSNEELDFSKLQESESESELESDDSSESDAEEDDNKEEKEEDKEEESDIPLSDAELDDDADVVPYQKVTVNNPAAIRRSLKSISLPGSAKAKFIEHMTVESEGPIELRDIYDDTERELAFYKQALHAAIEGRKLCKKNQIPFSRPTDFFAEMLKSDEHMSKVQNKLVSQEKDKLAAQEARKQRELKKYGKKVQNERLQQRAKEKREVLDKIQGLKRKRKNIDDERFDVEIEDAISDKKQSRDDKYKLGNQRAKKQPNRKRMAKNKKYGSGHSRDERKNTAESSMDVSGFRNKRRR